METSAVTLPTESGSSWQENTLIKEITLEALVANGETKDNKTSSTTKA